MLCLSLVDVVTVLCCLVLSLVLCVVSRFTDDHIVIQMILPSFSLCVCFMLLRDWVWITDEMSIHHGEPNLVHEAPTLKEVAIPYPTTLKEVPLQVSPRWCPTLEEVKLLAVDAHLRRTRNNPFWRNRWTPNHKLFAKTRYCVCCQTLYDRRAKQDSITPSINSCHNRTIYGEHTQLSKTRTLWQVKRRYDISINHYDFQDSRTFNF